MNREYRRPTTGRWKRRWGIEDSTGRLTRSAVSCTSASVSSHYRACYEMGNLKRPPESTTSCHIAHNRLVHVRDALTQLHRSICTLCSTARNHISVYHTSWVTLELVSLPPLKVWVSLWIFITFYINVIQLNVTPSAQTGVNICHANMWTGRNTNAAQCRTLKHHVVTRLRKLSAGSQFF
jgi:hypothetical protein